MSRTPSSLNSGGTFTLCASAARICRGVEYTYFGRVVRSYPDYTVSRIPEALGFPARRIGLPTIYLDSFLSRGSRVVFQAAAAAK